MIQSPTSAQSTFVMSIPHNENQLGQPLRNKKKRGAVFIVIVVSIGVHVLGLGVLGVMKIVEVISPPTVFEAPPVAAIERPPPPPPPPPTTKRMQRSLPRPQPLAAQNPQNMSVPAISLQDSDLSIGGGRGFGGGLGELGGAVADSIRITSFGFDQAMEGTLKGTLYDFKRDPKGKPIGTTREVLTPNFIKAIFNLNVGQLDRKFFKAEKSLYASYLAIPWGRSEFGPRTFGVEREIKANYIGVHYIGSYKPRKSGQFRLLGRGDNVLLVKVNGRLVLDGSVNPGAYSRWDGKNKLNQPAYFGCPAKLRTMEGIWFNLREGAETDVEIFIGETHGGTSGAYILIQDYDTKKISLFSTRPLSGADKAFLRKVHPDAAKFL